jgi:hypothetical protein
MKYLLVLQHIGYMRHFGELVERLAKEKEGHEIHIAVDHLPKNEADVDEITRNTLLRARGLAAKYPGVTLDSSITRCRKKDRWYETVYLLRKYRDYVRYFDRRYPLDSKLAERSRDWVPRWMTIVSKFLPLRNDFFRARFDSFLYWLERGIPENSKLRAFLKEKEFDAILVSPLVHPPGSFQTDYLKSGRSLGIPTCVCVASWDNLSNKGLFRIEPDMVTVWNEFQKEEAVTMQGVPERKVVVTGAQTFDEWFDWKPSKDRSEFCQTVGLDPARPIILYCCSSGFIAPNEPEFIFRWIAALRMELPSELRDVGILVRPHPKAVAVWKRQDPSALAAANVSIWPLSDGGASDALGKSQYFDSLFHCSAIVGLNTTAFVEAAILNKPVLTILDDKYGGTQEGTIHFHMLTNEDKGALLFVAKDFKQHADQVAGILRDPEAAALRCQKFVQHFIRPRGMSKPAHYYMIRALLDLPTVLQEPLTPSVWAKRLLTIPNKLHVTLLRAANKKIPGTKEYVKPGFFDWRRSLRVMLFSSSAET